VVVGTFYERRDAAAILENLRVTDLTSGRARADHGPELARIHRQLSGIKGDADSLRGGLFGSPAYDLIERLTFQTGALAEVVGKLAAERSA
jgi:hypothetical protein